MEAYLLFNKGYFFVLDFFTADFLLVRLVVFLTAVLRTVLFVVVTSPISGVSTAMGLI